MGISRKLTGTVAALLASAGIIGGLSACDTSDDNETNSTYSAMLEEGVSRAVDGEGKIFYLPRNGYDVADVYDEAISPELTKKFTQLIALQHAGTIPVPPFTWKKDPETKGLYMTDRFNRHLYREDGSPYRIMDERTRAFRLIIPDSGYDVPKICRTEFSTKSIRRFTRPQTTCRDVYDIIEKDDQIAEQIKGILEYHHDLHQS